MITKKTVAFVSPSQQQDDQKTMNSMHVEEEQSKKGRLSTAALNHLSWEELRKEDDFESTNSLANNPLSSEILQMLKKYNCPPPTTAVEENDRKKKDEIENYNKVREFLNSEPNPSKQHHLKNQSIPSSEPIKWKTASISLFHNCYPPTADQGLTNKKEITPLPKKEEATLLTEKLPFEHQAPLIIDEKKSKRKLVINSTNSTIADISTFDEAAAQRNLFKQNLQEYYCASHGYTNDVNLFIRDKKVELQALIQSYEKKLNTLDRKMRAKMDHIEREMIDYICTRAIAATNCLQEEVEDDEEAHEFITYD